MHISTFRTPFRHLPKLNGREVDLYMLYTLCTEQGGWIKVPIINFIFHQSTTLTTFDTARILTLIAIIIKYATAQNGSQQFIKFNMMHFYACILLRFVCLRVGAHFRPSLVCFSRESRERNGRTMCSAGLRLHAEGAILHVCVCVSSAQGHG